jgi:hypothetical protein
MRKTGDTRLRPCVLEGSEMRQVTSTLDRARFPLRSGARRPGTGGTDFDFDGRSRREHGAGREACVKAGLAGGGAGRHRGLMDSGGIPDAAPADGKRWNSNPTRPGIADAGWCGIPGTCITQRILMMGQPGTQVSFDNAGRTRTAEPVIRSRWPRSSLGTER